MATPDLTVRGAGIFGLSIAWEAARRGARVRVIDPGGIGAGSSGGVVGALAPHVPENWNDKKAFQLESLLAAESFWAGARDAGGADPLYARSGRLQPVVAGGEAAARARGVTAQTLWQGRAEWQVLPATGAEWEPQTGTGLMILDTLTARIHPRRALACLAAAIAAKGGEVLREGCEAGAVIHATGAAGLAALGIGGAVKGQAAVFALDLPDAPQLFIDALHIVPHGDGTVAIGSTSERTWSTPGPDAQLEALIARARDLCPALCHAPVIERWAGLRPRAPSRAPMLGAWPGRQGHFIANGGFKIGFGMAPGIATCMADLLEGRDTIPPAFRVEANLQA